VEVVGTTLQPIMFQLIPTTVVFFYKNDIDLLSRSKFEVTPEEIVTAQETYQCR
jgi:hypothetical protein